MLLFAQAEPSAHWITFVYPYLPLVGTLVAAVFAAYLSYNYWRRQELAKQNHDLAYRAISALIHCREEFWNARCMLMDSDEVEVYRKEFNHEPIEYGSTDKFHRAAFSRVGYSGRLNKLVAKYNDLRMVFLEVEALYGPKYRECLLPIGKFIREYRSALEITLHEETMKSLSREEAVRYRSKMSGSIDLESDTFGHQFEGHVEELIRKMRSHLIGGNKKNS